MIRKYMLLCTCILLLSLSGCILLSSSGSRSSPDVGVPKEEINSRVRLYDPPGLNNTYKNGDTLNMVIKIITSDQIAFPPNFGSRLFLLNDNQWTEVTNLMDYSNEQGQIILTPVQEDPISAFIGFSPYYEGLSKAQTLRVFIIGNLYSNGQVTPKQTAGSIDVVLKP